MKKLLIAVLSCGLLAAGGAALRAEEKPQEGGSGGGPGWRGHGPMADLTAEQRAAMKAAWRAHRDLVTPLKDKLEDEIERLKGLVEKAAPEKDLTASVDKVKELHRAVQAEREKFMDKMGASLSPMQRAKGVLMMARHMKGGHGFGPGMRGKGGHGGGGPGWGRHGGHGMKDALDDDDGAKDDDDDGPEPEMP